jgi:hypothetical protein
MCSLWQGFGVNRKAFYRYDWCLCRMCLAHPLLMSPGSLRRADVGGLRSGSHQWWADDC